jgi:hypothetical protein
VDRCGQPASIISIEHGIASMWMHAKNILTEHARLCLYVSHCISWQLLVFTLLLRHTVNCISQKPLTEVNLYFQTTLAACLFYVWILLGSLRSLYSLVFSSSSCLSCMSNPPDTCGLLHMHLVHQFNIITLTVRCFCTPKLVDLTTWELYPIITSSVVTKVMHNAN